MTMQTSSIDIYVEMFLRPVSTGVDDWVTIPAPLVAGGLTITDGNQDLNSDPGVPNRCKFVLNNTSGDFNRKNPLGAYWGSWGLGVQTRVGVWSVDDQFDRTVANTNWGSVGNDAGDTWTAGSSSGGTVAAGDWSIGSGTAKHSVPAANAYRWSELSKDTRLYRNVEVRRTFKVPVSNVTGGVITTDVLLRTVDINNAVSVSLQWQTDESLVISLRELVDGVERRLNFGTIDGVNLGTTGVDYELRCQVESSTVRAKVWPVGEPEPIGWQISGYGATLRSGYIGIADVVATGNSNTKPLVFETSQVQVRIPMFAGEVADTGTQGDGKSALKTASVDCAGPMERLQNGNAPAESALRRARSRTRRWHWVANEPVSGGTVRTFTAVTADMNGLTVGDFFWLNRSGLRKEDTRFTVTATQVSGSNTTYTFTPDARETVSSGDEAFCFRLIPDAQLPLAYWPCEDGESATQVSSGLPGGTPMSIFGPGADFASDSSFTRNGSGSILKVNDSDLRAPIPDYEPDGSDAISINFLLHMPDSDEAATGTDLLQFFTTGTGWSYDLQYESTGNGSLQLLVFNSAGTIVYDSGNIDFSLRGNPKLVSLVLEQATASTVTYRLFTINTAGISGGVGPITITGITTMGKITEIRCNGGGGYVNVGYGHLTVAQGVWDTNAVEFEFEAWARWPALRRYQLMADQDNFEMSFRDDWDVVSTNMGPQRVGRIGDLLKEPAQADMGFLHGMRGAAVLEYITRGAVTNQEAVATFVAADCRELELLTDYSSVVNRATVTRIDGTTAVAEKSEGPLSSVDAPEGVGLREQSFSLSLATDTQALNHAYARLGMGTLDQPRVPKVLVTSAGASEISLETLLSLGVGDRIDIAELSSMDVYDTLPQLVTGVRIALGNRFYPTVELNAVPYDVFRAFALTDDRYARPDMADTTTGSTLDETQTGDLTLVSAADYYLVTTDTADFPMDVMIDGERITLSAVVDTSTPGEQTATISARSVNGVIKSHAVGEDVVLAEPNYWQFR